MIKLSENIKKYRQQKEMTQSQLDTARFQAIKDKLKEYVVEE